MGGTEELELGEKTSDSSSGQSVTTDPTEPMLPKPSEETAWKSIYLAGACAFIQATQFAIFFASMWPYILTLKPDVKQSSFGFVVAAYSLSQCFCSVLFGVWSNKIGEVRLPLLVGFIIMAFGNTTYLSLQYLSDHHLIVMSLARLIAGGGTGNMSLLRAYASTASTLKDRSRAIAFVSGGISLGTMVGPGFQLLFTPLGAKGVDVLGVTVSIYTAPALFCLILNAVGLLIVQFAFEEKYIIQHKKTVKNGSETVSETEEKTIKKLGNPDFIAISLCVITRFLQIFLNTTTESIGSAYLMMMFSMEKEESVSVNAGIHTVNGVIGASMFVLFLFTNLSKHFMKRTLSVISLTLPFMWLIASYPWKFYTENVKIQVNGSNADCDLEKYSWCADQRKVPEIVYIAGYILVFGIGYTIMNITVPTIFSKVVGPRPQGTYQGIYQTAGSIGRMIAPLLMSYAYTVYGPSVPWEILIVCFIPVILAWILLRNRMVPFEEYETKKIKPADQNC
ncbi:unnamed protein product [Caenorhabditis brenneri]